MSAWNLGFKIIVFILLLFFVLEAMKDIICLTMHSTYFIYGYMASDIW